MASRGGSAQPKSGSGQSAAASGPGAEQAGVNTSRLDSLVPTFSNQMSDYREFRKRCEIYRKKMELGNRGSEVVYNLITLMVGKAWDLVEDMTIDDMAKSDAYDQLFQRLDRGFKYDPMTELPDDFEQFFVRLQRRGNQTLQDYMNDYTRAERRLEITHQVQLPDKVKAWWFLRKSGITKEQRQLILTNTGISGLTVSEVMKSMSFILGQDSKLDSSPGRWNRNAHKEQAYYFDEETYYEWTPGDDSVSMDAASVMLQDDIYAGDDWFDDEADYFDDAAFVDQDAVYDVEEYDEIFANYQDAKSKMNALRTSRGFYPVVAMMPTNVNPTPTGHGKKGRPKGKGKSPKGRSAPKGCGKAPNPKARAAAALGSGGAGRQLCLRCGNAGHWARNCPTPPSGDKKRKMDDDGNTSIHMVENAEVHTYDMEGDDNDYAGDDTAVQDGGAASVLGSA